MWSFKPKAKDDDEEKFTLAEGLLTMAGEAEEKRKYNEAFDLYQQSLALWLEILQKETRDDKKVLLSDLINQYLKRAENLKKDIDSVASRQAQTNSATPSLPQMKKSLSNNAKVPNKGAKPTQENNSSSKQSNIDSNSNEYESQILSDMMDASPQVYWSDIAGLAYAKQTIQEAIILPNLRPDLFQGLRSPPRGVLFYGPPGTPLIGYISMYTYVYVYEYELMNW